ncbi:MAG TPA: hypothetical protein ENH10_02790 [Bacteroidetes bacterium]|nr:hypothetical protein [Bacteroidota bacterium]HEX04067.1 hypothetical protein [Bacteroidota bacterium]
MLRQLGAPLDHDSDQRAGVYLTNALTGWEPLENPKDELPLYPELKEERDAANKVKQEAPILVIIGNPPYNAFAGTSPKEEGDLVKSYKEGLTTPVKQGGWGIKKFNLDDLYVRFFRIAERRIAKSGKGVVSFISNYSWTSEPSFVVLRKRLLQSFDKFWIENMHGNRKISEYAPDGRTSETVFAIPGFSAGIQQGIVTSLWVRGKSHQDESGQLAKVFYRDDIDAARAVERRQQLLDTLLLEHPDRNYETASPSSENRFSFRPETVSKEYLIWPRTNDIASEHHNGPVERRAFALISMDKKPLIDRMQAYFGNNISDEEIKRIYASLMMTGNRIVGPDARRKIQHNFVYDEDCVVRYPFKPFDLRFCYLENLRPLFSEPSPKLINHSKTEGQSFFITRDTADKYPEGVPFYYSRLISDYDSISGHARHFPIRLRNTPELPKEKAGQDEMFEHEAVEPTITANLSKTARTYLTQLDISNPDTDAETAGLIWMHALAIGYSPTYLDENADGIRQDWPRIPLPATKQALLDSAGLGRRVAALLDTEKPVDGVTAGTIDPRLRPLGVICKVGGGSLDPDKGELDMTAGWGHKGARGVCMPGRGRVETRNTVDSGHIESFGGDTLDIYLNDIAYWENVPPTVWSYTIGGYQVIKKWLSYREKVMLGRGLKMDEALYVTEMVRRIASLILLQPELNANYEAVKADTWPWPTK